MDRVATALPTIVAKLGGGKNYSWVGRFASLNLYMLYGWSHWKFDLSSYLLTSAALGPLYGKLADVVGRKLVLYPVIFVFLVSRANQDDLTNSSTRRVAGFRIMWSCSDNELAHYSQSSSRHWRWWSVITLFSIRTY